MALQVTRLLRAPGPLAGLRSLALRSAAACGDAVEALADGQLPQLRHLQLAVPAASVRAVGVVGRALAGLRRLHSLTLRPAPAAEALDGIAAADMPALRLVVVLGSCLPSAAGQSYVVRCRAPSGVGVSLSVSLKPLLVRRVQAAVLRADQAGPARPAAAAHPVRRVPLRPVLDGVLDGDLDGVLVGAPATADAAARRPPLQPLP